MSHNTEKNRAEKRRARREQAKETWQNRTVTYKTVIEALERYDLLMISDMREQVAYLSLPPWKRWALVVRQAWSDVSARVGRVYVLLRGTWNHWRTTRKVRKMERLDRKEAKCG